MDDQREAVLRLELSEARAHGDAVRISKALVAAVFADPDGSWLEEQCVQLLDHENVEIRGVAATCLGHIARIHGLLDRERVIEQLRGVVENPRLAGRVEDALSDISIFMSKDEIGFPAIPPQRPHPGRSFDTST